jgi:hypothetical protein
MHETPTHTYTHTQAHTHTRVLLHTSQSVSQNPKAFCFSKCQVKTSSFIGPGPRSWRAGWAR